MLKKGSVTVNVEKRILIRAPTVKGGEGEGGRAGGTFHSPLRCIIPLSHPSNFLLEM
jgi:hypothetical protein